MTCSIEISNRTTIGDLDLLNQLQQYFGGSTIQIDQIRNRVIYSVYSIK